ncbi:MAG: secretin and TonB N-terminal domain-containing protein [Candidatus Omnitrophica bacterium]|nr:secretin and TonB N-terminal domain-containing protein [Candidatus Omnitrophota bacterium]
MRRIFVCVGIISIFLGAACIPAQAQQAEVASGEADAPLPAQASPQEESVVPETGAAREAGMDALDEMSAEEMEEGFFEPEAEEVTNVTLDFKEADILNVLKIISYKAGVNIVTTPDVVGNVTVRLVDVPWETALDVILKTYGFAYQRQGNIILVGKLENISKLQQEEPLKTEIFKLRFLDAQDAEKILIPLLSPRGKVSLLYTRGQKGWKFGTFKIGKSGTTTDALERENEDEPREETISIERTPSGDVVSKKAVFEPSIKSKTLLITDTPASLDRIRNVILPQIDKKPQQVLIETRIMEVNRDKLRDMGMDWGTGTSGASGYLNAPADLSLNRQDTHTLGDVGGVCSEDDMGFQAHHR